MFYKIFKTSEASRKAWETRRNKVNTTGSLGVLRKDMPQIAQADMASFMHFAAEHKVTVMRGKTVVSTLKPAQAEYNAAQVAQLPESALKKPITISKDGYILDGHNRWARLRQEDPDQEVVTNRIMLGARDALKFMHSFPKSFTKDVKDVGETTKKADLISKNIARDLGLLD